MKRFFKNLLLLTLALLLACGSALADVDALSADIEPWLEGGVQTAVTVELEQLMPFGEDTLKKLQGVAKHLRLEMRVDDAGEAARLTLGGEPIFSAVQSGDGLRLDLLPSRTLAGEDAALALSGTKGEHTPAYTVLSAAYQSDEQLPALSALLERDAEEKKSAYKVKQIGTSKTSRVLKLTKDQLAEYSPAVLQMLLCGTDEETRLELDGATCQKGFSVALYYLEDGSPMALLLKGKLDGPKKRQYTVNYVWGFKRGDEVQADSCKLTLTGKGDGAKTRTIVGTRKRTLGGKFELETDCTVTVKQKGVTDKYISSVPLKGKSGSARTLSGTLKTDHQHVAKGSQRYVTTVKPQLSLADGKLSGSISLLQTLDKKEQTALTLNLHGETGAELDALGGFAVSGEFAPAPAAPAAEAPVGMSAHTPPSSPQTLLLSALTDEEKADLWDEAAQQMAARLLVAVSRLPEGDRALLTDGMNEQDAQALIELLGI